jgi:molybdopterin synthase sulfur carrier subunit
MAITLKFIGALRHASGVNSQIVDCPDCSVKDLICKASENSLELRQSLIAEDSKEIRANALILVNGKEISILNGLNTKLRDGDEVVFVPVVHGG